MTSPAPLATVVIPTQNRRDAACRALEALGRQTVPPERFDIVISANACRDGTAERLRGIRLPSVLQVLDLPSPGAAAARNAGAAVARGTLLIFLDDDIEVDAGFVAAHLAAHGIGESSPAPDPARVAVGYLPALLQPEADLFAIALREWWEAMFDRMREPGHRFAYNDLLTGNFSVRREYFLRLGGFDERYRCHEDYEFGYKLIASGARFVFVEEARGHHADLTRLSGACRRKREEGQADVQLARQYPDLLPALPLANRRSPRLRLVRWLAFRAPRTGDTLAALLGRSLPPLERVGARSSWQRLLNAMLGYWYERGLADAAQTPAMLQGMLAHIESNAATGSRDLHVDVSDVEAAERLLDEHRPAGVVFCVGSRPFGRIPRAPGAEALAGRHLRPALSRIWHRFYVEALLEERRLPLLGPDAADFLETAHATRQAGDAAELIPEPAPPRPRP